MTPAEANRLRFPEFSKWLDEMREAFGQDVRVIGCREGTETAGIQPEDASARQVEPAVPMPTRPDITDAGWAALEAPPTDDW